MNHVLHPGHLLFIVDDGNNYTCNGCNFPGRGARYRCNLCNFDLHLLCARCPPQVPFLGHPHDLMTLIPQPERLPGNGASLRRCDGCRQMVEGMYYHLEGGNFDLHPICLVRQLQQAQVAPDPVIAQERNLAGPRRGVFGYLLGLVELGFNVLSVLGFFGVDIADLINGFNV